MTDSNDPILLYGALRSGSTLLRLMMMNHPDIWSPGEADFLLDYLHRDPAAPDGWRFDTDGLSRERIFLDKKIDIPQGVTGLDMPRALVAAMQAQQPGKRMALNIHRNAPKMAEVFPTQPIVHLLRDPRDVARSSIGMGWCGNTYYGVTHWIDTERSWDATGIDAARVHEIRFEDLVVDLEEGLGRICAFLGLPYSDRMLGYHESSTYDPPNPSMKQKWRTEADPREITRAEARVGTLMVDRGYEPSAPLREIGGLERTWLAAENRALRWQHNMKRYGVGLFLSHHAARALGWTDMERKLHARQEAIRAQSRK